MEALDLRVILGAINRMILKSKLNFSVRIERTFIHTGIVLMICCDKKSLELPQKVVQAIATTLMDHQGYEARGLLNMQSKQKLLISGFQITKVWILKMPLNWSIDVIQRPT